MLNTRAIFLRMDLDEITALRAQNTASTAGVLAVTTGAAQDNIETEAACNIIVADLSTAKKSHRSAHSYDTRQHQPYRSHILPYARTNFSEPNPKLIQQD